MNRWVLWSACAVVGLGLSPLTASAQVVQGNEAATAVATWFQKYLGRQPSPQALNFWTNQLRVGVSPIKVRAAILGSPDYYALNSGVDEGFIVGLFRDVAGRATSLSEVRHQVARLREKNTTRTSFAEDFIIRAGRGEFNLITTWNPNARPVVVVEPTVVVPVQPVVVVPVPIQQPGAPAPVDPNAPPAPPANPFR
jgi:hypothetical protein